MPRLKLHPHEYNVRLSDPTKKALDKRAKQTGAKPRVILRDIIEGELLNPKGGNHVRSQG